MNKEDLEIEVCKRIGAVDEELTAVMAHVSYDKFDEAIASVDKLICEAQKLKLTLRASIGKNFRVKVNGKELVFTPLVDKPLHLIGYEDVVRLAHPEQPDLLYSVTYSKADGEKTEGTMWPNCPPVAIKDGTRFECYFTGNA